MLTTGLGGQRLIDELEDDPLPRICLRPGGPPA